MIEILKASAGSGKTYNLALKYLRLLLENSDNFAYRHILAVTFTNKATDEMKGRILKELYVLAKTPADSPYHDEFVPSIFPDDSAMSGKAGTVLCNILHDYGAFAVSTIDKFFQQTLKAFSREIGRFDSYQLELDKDALIEESVDRVLDSLTGETKDEKKLRWLTDSAIEQLEDGKGYRLEYSLKNIAKRLKSEEHRSKVEACGLDESVFCTDTNLAALAASCRDIVTKFRAGLEESAKAVLEEFRLAGIDPKDTSRGFMDSGLRKYIDLGTGAAIYLPSNSFRSKVDSPDDWFPKAKANLRVKVTRDILDALSDFMSYFDMRFKEYSTAALLLGKIYGFGIAIDLYNAFDEIQKEKNILSIDETNTILRNIIDGTEAPFIYEKIGVKFEHFLLDEFQDTSRVQWDNFRPLLSESISEGNYNLIVGDVKQSIYRWRGSDWELLQKGIADEFGTAVSEHTLDTNWRSKENIVEFNNDFFKYVAGLLDGKYDDQSVSVAGIYSDVEQKTARKNLDGGSVRVSFAGSAEEESEAVLTSIRTALDAGFKYGDVAILVRGNEEGSALAASLIGEGIPVVTDESLKIFSSITVRRLMSLLSSIDNPDDKTAAYLAGMMDIELPESYHSLVDLCESLLRGLRKYDEAVFEAESCYVRSFMDKVQEFMSSDGNGLHAFLKEMEGDNSSISSPSVGNSVRIMTIHKSKGLDFPYVIVPFVEKVGLFRPGSAWCRPAVEGTALEGVVDGVFDVTLSSKSLDTLFGKDYKDELFRQYVDNINIMYVAFTRAAQALHVIALEEAEGDSDFSQILSKYVDEHPEYKADVNDGPDICAACSGKAEENDGDWRELPASYPSWPIEGRLTFSKDSSDFFSEDGCVGVSASRRLNGIVLHGILAQVIAPDDLDDAVQNAVSSGLLSSDEAVDAANLLKERVTAAQGRGWFPSDRSKVRNEAAIFDSDGELFRPDRVVTNPDGTITVIDYKFAGHSRKYVSQVRQYADLYRQMGYEVSGAFLWFVEKDEVVDCC